MFGSANNVRRRVKGTSLVCVEAGSSPYLGHWYPCVIKQSQVAMQDKWTVEGKYDIEVIR